MSVVSGENWLAIGDAAMAFDPLSSQGLYNAMRSALDASEAVRQHLSGKSDALRDYAIREQERFPEFLERRSTYYRRETRWRDAPFWNQRVAVR
jgi:flavin-dependent dehydrogenase